MAGTKQLSPWEAAPSWAVNPMTPAKREAFRTEVQRKQDKVAQDAMHKLSRYQKPATKPVHLGTEAEALTNPHALALHQLSGQLPTPASQRADRAVANVNILRFTRTGGSTGAPQRDGGPLYSPTTLEANWVEETRDRNYRKAWHAKELRRNQLWDSESVASYTLPAEHKVKTLLVAQPKSDLQAEVQPHGEGSGKTVVNYALEGFGPEQHQDHTCVTKRGGHWLGIAPVLDGKESITTTSISKGHFLEFQMRTPTTDTKAKLLGTVPGGHSPTPEPEDPWRQKARDDLLASQRFASTWQSSYKRDFNGFKEKAGAPLRPTSCISSLWANYTSGLLTARPATSA